MKKKLLGILIALFCIPLSFAMAEPSVDYISNYHTGSMATDVFISGNYAYLADADYGLKIMDISDPASPELLSSSEDWTHSVVVVGNYAYLSASEYSESFTGVLKVVDISDPAAPVLVGSCDMTENGGDIAVSGNYAYVSAGNYGMDIFDISDPATPSLLLNLPVVNSTTTTVTVSGDYVYLGDNGTLRIFDISDPANPITEGYIAVGGSIGEIVVSGHFAYVAGYGVGLVILSISDPGDPIIIGNSTNLSRAYGLTISGNYAYVASVNYGLEIYDISNLAVPVLVSNDIFTSSYEAKKIAISGNHAYVASGSMGLRIFDISDPTAVSFESENQFGGGQASNFTIIGNYAYVADLQSGLHIYDISEPAEPRQIISYNSLYNSSSFADGTQANSEPLIGINASFINSNYAIYSLGTFEGVGGVLEIIDISDVYNPVFEGNIIVDGYPSDINISGHYAYVTDTQGLYIFDITDPTDATLVGTIGKKGSIKIMDNYVYLGGGSNDISVINVTDPSAPELVGSYNSDDIDTVNDMDILSNYIYLMTEKMDADDEHSTQSMKIFNIFEPTSPVLVSTYDFDDSGYRVSVYGDYAYVIGDPDIQILNIADPTAPSLLLTKNTSDDSRYKVTADTNGYLYIGGTGFSIYTADLDDDGEIDDHSDVAKTSGATDGTVKVKFAAGDSRYIKIFDIITDEETIIKRYKHTNYYLALHPFGKKIAMFNAITGEIFSMKTLTKDLSLDRNALKISTVRGKNAAVVTSKDMDNNVLLSLVRITGYHTLKKTDQKTLVNDQITVSKTKVRPHKIILRNESEHNIIKYLVTKRLNLKEQ